MRWIDLAGPPGVGKSTLVDGLWPPRCIEWDKEPYPNEWAGFMKVTNKLMKKINHHPSAGACYSMIQRSFRKMSTIFRMNDNRVYIQTGLIQRGLGLGWRLEDQEDIREYFEVMPISLGAIILSAPVDVIQKRNVDRNKDRSYMVSLMERPRQIAIEVLRDRLPLMELDTTRPIDENITRILCFSGRSSESSKI